jgi:hypothetical protein
VAPPSGRCRQASVRALRRLDLLISVDTLSAHLGGALGVPTWTLLHADADWRWMEARDDTPWYPTMRLFRQRQQGNWQEVLERVTHALTDRLLADLCASRADGRCYEDPAAIAMPRRASAASPVPAGCKFVRR